MTITTGVSSGDVVGWASFTWFTLRMTGTTFNWSPGEYSLLMTTFTLDRSMRACQRKASREMIEFFLSLCRKNVVTCQEGCNDDK